MDVSRNPERWRSHPVSLFRFPFFKAVVRRKNIVSWTSSPIPFHIYTVDRYSLSKSELQQDLKLNIGCLNASLPLRISSRLARCSRSSSAIGMSAGLFALCRAHSYCAAVRCPKIARTKRLQRLQRHRLKRRSARYMLPHGLSLVCF